MVCIISQMAGSSWDEFLHASYNAYQTLQISVDSNNQLKINVPGWEKAQEIYNKIFRFALPFSVAVGALGVASSVVTYKALVSRSYGQAYVGVVATLVHTFFCLSGIGLIDKTYQRIRRYEEMPKQIEKFRTNLLQHGISKVKELDQQLPRQWKDKVSFNVLSEQELLTLIQQTKNPALILPYFDWIPKKMSIQAPCSRIFKAEHSFKHSQAGTMLAEQLIHQSKIALEMYHGTLFWDKLNKIQWTPITDEQHSKALDTMLRKQIELLCSKPSDVPDVKTMILQYCDEAKKLYFAKLFKTAIDATCNGSHNENVARARQALEGVHHVDKELLLEAFKISIKSN